MITFSKFGNYGRLGNQLFQYASMLGLANKYNTPLVLPFLDWFHYIKHPPSCGSPKVMPLREKHYHYDESQFELASQTDVDILGWLQSEKYWEHCKDYVKERLQFSNYGYILTENKINGLLDGRPTIAISIRRGDYVDNPNYELLNADYYYLALLEHFPDWRDYQILIFSDDIPYCKVHFECLPNVYFVEGEPFEQLILGSMCDHFIVANSTFSWWMAYLGEKEHSKIIRPAYLFAGELLKTHDDKDFWPERWTKFDHKGKKLDLRDTTFLIPFTKDSEDREVNFNTIKAQLSAHFTAKDFSGNPMAFGGKFHRTNWLNNLTFISQTPYVINYDCDILVPPLQIWLAIEQLRRNEADMVYPYDGRFARVPRTWVQAIKKYNDVGVFKDNVFRGSRPGDSPSVGGVIAYRKDKFIESGGENEKMVSYAPEDVERFYRWNKLGYRVTRIKGQCFHIDHEITTNSSTTHPDYKNNEKELQYVKSLTESQLREYVNSWGYFGEVPNVSQ